jgi:hypothetical protein
MTKNQGLTTRTALRLAALAGLAAVIGGCATPMAPQNMVPTTVATGKQHPGSVSVDVSGGADPAKTPFKISNDMLKQALTESITKYRTFSRVVEGKGGDYLLTVQIFNLDQPLMGMSMTVKMEAGWTLKRADGGATVWQETISSQHTTGAGEAFAGVERVRMATEGAARSNIATGLAKISQLNL